MRTTFVHELPRLDAVDLALLQMTFALDNLLTSMLLLAPNAKKWPVPTEAIQEEMRVCADLRRCQSRVDEVLDRLRLLVPMEVEDDLSELARAVVRLRDEAGAVGFRAGVSLVGPPMARA